jgi:hypothetical protein
MSNPSIIEVIDLDTLVDITATLSDLNAEDTVYQTPDGMVIKVKALLIPVEDEFGQNHGHVGSVKLSGSVCGADGKTLVLASGDPDVFDLGRTLHFKAEGLSDYRTDIEGSRRLCVADTYRAVGLRDMLEGHEEGFGPMVTVDAFKARKAAEVQ